MCSWEEVSVGSFYLTVLDQKPGFHFLIKIVLQSPWPVGIPITRLGYSLPTWHITLSRSHLIFLDLHASDCLLVDTALNSLAKSSELLWLRHSSQV